MTDAGGHDRATDATLLRDRDSDAPAPTRTLPGSPVPSSIPGNAGDAEYAGADTRVRTRDLLAEIATRDPHAPHLAERGRREWRFVRWTLVTLALVLGALFVSLYWLDPISVTGRSTRFSVVENGGVRQAKLDLMEKLKTPPEVLVLGSSRSMKIDPADITRVSGATAFNAGVSGGTSKDFYLYTRYAEQLWGGKGRFPHLVVGVVNDVLRDDGTAAFDPRLKPFLTKSDKQRDPLEITQALLQWKTVDAARHAIPSVVRRDGLGALAHPVVNGGRASADLAKEGKQEGNQIGSFRPNGYQIFNPVKNLEVPIDRRVEAQMKVYITNGYDHDPGFDGADPAGVQRLRQLIQVANRNGDVPTLWLTPFQPHAQEMLPPEYRERDRTFRAAIDKLHADPSLRFEWVDDFSDLSSFGGKPDEFFDGIHMMPSNTARVVAELQSKGLLAPGHVADAAPAPAAAG